MDPVHEDVGASTSIHIRKTVESFTVECSNRDPIINLLTLLTTYDQMAKKFVAGHTCGDPTCIQVELHEQILHEINAVRYRYITTMQNRGVSSNVDLRRVFILAMNEHKQPELINIDTLLRQQRFNDINRWFEVQVQQCIGIKPGIMVKTVHFQNMVEFLRKNGARMVDLDAFAKAWETIQYDEKKENGTT